jgi:hypothetical protein
MLPNLYTQACAVDWNYLHISFSSQMIRFSSSGLSQTCGTWPYFPFFPLSSFFVISCHFVFSPENVSCDKYYHRCKKLNSKACIHVKILKLHHVKGTISKNIWIHQKFLVGGNFAPSHLFNLCNALSECFYIWVLLGSSECFYWVLERCFVIQCDLATNPLFCQIMFHVTHVIFQGKYTCKHSEVAAALR